MSKIGAYLQEHISGEVSISRDVRESVSRDSSVLKLRPEMVIFPKNTNDIRKVARFCWQLAERGHVLPITPRGLGGDETGASIGSGIILSFPAHMDSIFEFEPKQRLVRVQPGVPLRSLLSALRLYGVRIPALSDTYTHTVGGAIANNARSMLSGKYGAVSDWIDRLEVVLANGEVIQTGRINKKELNRKKGLGTLEGEIYRSIDNLIEDNKALIATLASRMIGTNAGYCSIASVKRKDGSFDLSPLIVGSQGTLGIISEVIMKADLIERGLTVIAAAFKDEETARDAADIVIAKEKPAFLESFDAALFENALLLGKTYPVLSEAGFEVKNVLLIGFDDDSKRAREHRARRTEKILSSLETWYQGGEGVHAYDLLAIRNALVWAAAPEKSEFGATSVIGGAYIPPEGLNVYQAGVKTLAKKHAVSIPIYGQNLQSLYYAWPNLNLKKAGDKQKMLKILDEHTRLVLKVGGELIGADGEGRLRTRFALSTFDDETLQLFSAVKAAFDPHKIMNPGVKESVELKQLVPMIQNEQFHSSLPNYLYDI